MEQVQKTRARREEKTAEVDEVEAKQRDPETDELLDRVDDLMEDMDELIAECDELREDLRMQALHDIVAARFAEEAARQDYIDIPCGCY